MSTAKSCCRFANISCDVSGVVFYIILMGHTFFFTEYCYVVNSTEVISNAWINMYLKMLPFPLSLDIYFHIFVITYGCQFWNCYAHSLLPNIICDLNFLPLSEMRISGVANNQSEHGRFFYV